MYPYSIHIPRCTHIKTNGTQCGSPALHGRRFCFFHRNWRGQRIQLDKKVQAAPAVFTLPVLEDANSVQIALMQVIQLLLSGRIDSKTAGLLLYALQTASLNLKQTNLEPMIREQVVIDPGSVRDTQLGENVWDEQDFEDEEEEAGEDQDEEDQDEENENDQGEDDEEQQYRDGQDFAKMLLEHLALPGHTGAENDDDDHG